MASSDKLKEYVITAADGLGWTLQRGNLGWYHLVDGAGRDIASNKSLVALEYYIHGFRTGITLCQKSEALNDQRRAEEERS